MSAAVLLAEIQQLGVCLEARGDTLHAEASQDILTPELVARLKAHKAELLTVLEESIGARIAQDHGLTLADLQQAAGLGWPENDSAILGALANSITIRRMREHGEVPSNYTSTTICAHCGPVPIYPGMAEHVLGCPWCFNRVKGLPVPKVSTKTQVQDLGPAMLKREGCEGHKWSDYYPSEKVRVGKLVKSEV